MMSAVATQTHGHNKWHKKPHVSRHRVLASRFSRTYLFHQPQCKVKFHTFTTLQRNKARYVRKILEALITEGKELPASACLLSLIQKKLRINKLHLRSVCQQLCKDTNSFLNFFLFRCSAYVFAEKSK